MRSIYSDRVTHDHAAGLQGPRIRLGKLLKCKMRANVERIERPYTVRMYDDAKFKMEVAAYNSVTLRYTVTLAGGAIALSTHLRPTGLYGTAVLIGAWSLLLVAVLLGIWELEQIRTLTFRLMGSGTIPKEEKEKTRRVWMMRRWRWHYRCLGMGFVLLVAAATMLLVWPESGSAQ